MPTSPPPPAGPTIPPRDDFVDMSINDNGVGRGAAHKLPIPTIKRPLQYKTALVLAGGGIAGAVYEIGALRAMNDLLVDRTVNDFDIFVGTSAGSLITSMLANGLTTQEMMQSLNINHPELRAIRVDDVFQRNFSETLARLRKLPFTLLRTGNTFLRNFREITLADILWDLADVLPNGLYDGTALERYVEIILDRPGCVNRFDLLEKTLYIVATELDTGERAVFGKGGKGIVPISKAVAASSAIPILYKPMSIYGKEYIDGVFRGTASLDLAIEAGAKLVVCINPLAPIDARHLEKLEHLSERGAQTVLSQVMRILFHSGLKYHIKNLRTKYPDVDIILIEPSSDDYEMFFQGLMSYSARLTIAEHAFKRVTLGLNENYPYFKTILARHGIQISRRKALNELEIMRRGSHDPAILRHIMQESAVAESLADLLPLSDAMSELECSLSQLNLAISR